jgi:hypothetical protein
MSAILKVRSKEREMPFLESRTKMPVKKLPAEYIINMQTPVITNPIDPKRISKESTNSLTMGSAVKAVLVFAGTFGLYHLFKNVNVFSYFGLGEKNTNSKDVNSRGIMELKNGANALTVKSNLETARQVVNSPSVNRIVQTYKKEDRTVKFEETKIEEFKNLPLKKDRDVDLRRSVFNPTFKGSYNTPGDARGIFVSGNYAYVACSGLWIIDVSDPSNPKFKGSYNTPDRANEVTVSGDYAYVAAWESGLQIIDIKDPSNPTFKGAYGTPYPRKALDVAISDNYAYVTNDANLLIVDVSDPSNPTLKGECYSPFTARAVVLSGNYAYVADFASDLEIIDISDSSNPTFVGSYDISGNAWGIDVSSNYAYLVGGSYGLQIIDVSDPSNPSLKGVYDTPGEAFGVTVSENYAYVADDTSLQIIDISDPSNPIFKASYETSAWRVVISGNYAYVAARESGLQIIALGPETDSDLTVTFTIIGSVIGAVCISSFCFLLLIIGGGIVAIRRNRNKTVKNENNIDTKEQELKEESAKV